MNDRMDVKTELIFSLEHSLVGGVEEGSSFSTISHRKTSYNFGREI